MPFEPTDIQRGQGYNRDIEEHEVKEAVTTLKSLAKRFQKDAGRYPKWPSKKCAKNLRMQCSSAGVLAYELVKAKKFRLSKPPDWLLEEPVGIDDTGGEVKRYSLWWLAFLRWLDKGKTVVVKLPHTTGVPSYPQKVFLAWTPGTRISRQNPYLTFQPSVCKKSGADACLQSAKAIDHLLCILIADFDRGRDPTCPVELNGQLNPVIVHGNKKYYLRETQYDVIEALVEEFPKRLKESVLISISRHKDARGILKRLAESHEDWKSVISLAGEAGRGYGLAAD